MGLMAALTVTEDPKFLYKGVGRDQKDQNLCSLVPKTSVIKTKQ